MVKAKSEGLLIDKTEKASDSKGEWLDKQNPKNKNQKKKSNSNRNHISCHKLNRYEKV